MIEHNMFLVIHIAMSKVLCTSVKKENLTSLTILLVKKILKA